MDCSVSIAVAEASSLVMILLIKLNNEARMESCIGIYTSDALVTTYVQDACRGHAELRKGGMHVLLQKSLESVLGRQARISET